MYNHNVKVGDCADMENQAAKKAASLQVLPTEEYFARVRQSLSEKGQAYVRVTGMSMWPLLHHLRDGVILIPPHEIRRGDIVLFARESGRYALHRVIEKKGEIFTMAGDHQWHMEKGLPCRQIIGVAAMLHRKGRFIPCKNFLIKIYAAAVTLLTAPRIYLRRAARFLLRPLLKQRKAPSSKGDQNP